MNLEWKHKRCVCDVSFFACLWRARGSLSLISWRYIWSSFRCVPSSCPLCRLQGLMGSGCAVRKSVSVHVCGEWSQLWSAGAPDKHHVIQETLQEIIYDPDQHNCIAGSSCAFSITSSVCLCPCLCLPICLSENLHAIVVLKINLSEAEVMCVIYKSHGWGGGSYTCSHRSSVMLWLMWRWMFTQNLHRCD